MPIALFDLDHTLIEGDSDFLWGQFLSEQGIVDPDFYAQENRRFYDDYLAGTLNIAEFLAFSLKPLADNATSDLLRWREQFVSEKIRPIMLPQSTTLMDDHRARGDTVVIITATNRFVTEPIAQLFGVEHLIATEPEMVDGRFTGAVNGTPSYAGGKVTRLAQWLAERDLDMGDSWFYSDSHNDLPLLHQVTHPVAVNPDEILRETAAEAGWPIRQFGL